MFNLFSLLENETIEIFSMGERSKRKRKFGGIKVCKVDKITEYFINLKVKNETID